MTKLTEAVSSKYFDASAKLRGKKYKLVRVFVEGYDDISFWRCIFDEFEDERVKFEISVPVRGDLAKGKKVVMSMIPNVGENMILCVDSDFDYLFGNFNEQSRLVNNTKYLFQTYTYATENYLCYPPSLRRLCVRATKNDTNIFDFEEFMRGYSRIIYPLFVWYAFSAQKSSQKSFTLADFRNIVRLHYVDLRDNGANTLAWLTRQTEKKLKTLEKHNSDWLRELPAFQRKLHEKGVTKENVYLFMQGHTLKDNVVVVLLQNVCDKLRELSNNIINNSDRRGQALRNELSNYNNSLRNVKDLLNENTNYKTCFLYKKLEKDIETYRNELK
ncbi:MAG: DUF4435 domain-containing protein [Rikenellaceae bacterium]|nr:DUF4435 domain-containing protein [Rikenellaceae bacterium]